MPLRALARAGLASLASLAACNSLTGVDDLTFDGEAVGGASGSGGEGGKAGSGGTSGAGGEGGGSGASCLPTTPASACHKCCEDTFKKGKLAFETTAPSACACPEGCEQDCSMGGCDGAAYTSLSCRACVATACPASCPAGAKDCQDYAACMTGCGLSPTDHGSCHQSATVPICRTCCQSAHKEGFTQLTTSNSLKTCACGQPACQTACGTTCASGIGEALCAGCLAKNPCPGLCPPGSPCEALLTCLGGCEK